jgi:hypothetical protein
VSGAEYDYEPIPGLPGYLPEGEQLLWQGRPAAWPLARRALRVVPVGIYFALLLVWQCVSLMQSHHGWRQVAHAIGLPLLLGAAVLGLLTLIGWAAARATVYSITSRRLVIRHGIALPMSLNLPFRHVDSAALCMRADGTGDVSLLLTKGQRVGYLLTWPHVRAGHYLQPQPTLRALPDARQAAEVLATALTQAARDSEVALPEIVRVAKAPASTAPASTAPASTAPAAPAKPVRDSRSPVAA